MDGAERETEIDQDAFAAAVSPPAPGLPVGPQTFSPAETPFDPSFIVDEEPPVDIEDPSLREMEPSLDLYWSSPVDDHGASYSAGLPPAEHIDFPSSRNSPEMPGSTSQYISRWETHDLEPFSPHSEASFHSSIYPPSGRTSTGGALEPRTLVRSSESKPGLATGDVVMLLREDRPYIAMQVQLPYKTDAWQTCLEVTEDGITPESESLAYLEVVKQGAYFCFRSGAAGNRFLQTRRKPPHRLAFYNANCGIWEHWELRGRNADSEDAWRAQPWSQLPFVLRNRRLPQVELSVDMVRVGYFTVAGAGGAGASTAGPPFSLTPRSLQLPVIPEESRVEDTNLTRMSNVLVAEWFKFVDSEKRVRAGVEEDVSALKEDLVDFKMNIIQQVEYLREHMNEEMGSLADELAGQGELVGLLKHRCRRMQQLAANKMARARARRVLHGWRLAADERVYHKAAVLRLTSRRNRVLREAAFWAWLHWVQRRAGHMTKLEVALQRRCHALMSLVMAGWQQAVAHRTWRGRTVMAAVDRRSARRLAGSFAQWRLEAVQRAAGRAALTRALQGVRQTGLAAILTAWREAAQTARRKEVQVELLLSRRAGRTLAACLAEWSDVVYLRRFLSRYARTALLRRTLTRWRAGLVAAHERQRAAAGLAAAAAAAVQRTALRAWHDAAALRGSYAAKLRSHVAARSTRLEARVLGAWGRLAQEKRRWRVALARHRAALRLRLAGAVMAAWRAVAALRGAHRAKLLIMAGRTSNRMMFAVLSSWRAHTAARRARVARGALVSARIRRSRLATCLGRWRQLVARLKLGRHRLVALCQKLLGCTLSRAFREWRLLTRTAVAARATAARALPPSTRDLLSRLLGMWWARHCSPLSPLTTAAAADATRGSRRRAASASPGAAATSGVQDDRAAEVLGAADLSLTPAASISPLGVPAPTASQSGHAQLGASVSSMGASTAPVRSSPTVPPGPFASSPQTLSTGGTEADAGMPAGATLQPQSAQGASRSASPTTHGSAATSPARPPLHPAMATPPASPLTSAPGPAGSPSPMTSQGAPHQGYRTPVHQHQAGAAATGSRRNSTDGGGSHFHGWSGVLVPGQTPSTGGSSQAHTRTPGRSYREALVAGGSSAGPTSGGGSAHGAHVPTGSSAPESRSSSAGRTRPSGGESGASPGSFVLALSGSSPVVRLEVSPGGTHSEASTGAAPVVSPWGPLPLGEAAHQRLALPAGRQPADSRLRTGMATRDASGFSGFPVGPQTAPGSGGEVSSRTVGATGPAAASPPAAVRSSAPAFSGGSSSSRELGRWLAAAVLVHWRRAVACRRLWVRRLEAVAAHLQRRRLGEVLAGWRDVVAAAQGRCAAADALAARRAARGQLRSLHEVLMCWHLVAHRRVVTRALAARHTARAAVALSAAVLAAWHEAAGQRAAAKRKVARLCRRREGSALDVTFRGWRLQAVDARARRAAAGELATNHRRELMSSALAGWCGAAQERRARAARQARASRFGERRRLAGAFRQWRWAAEAASERQVVAERASRQAALRAAFGSWFKAAVPSGGQGYLVDPEAAMQRAAGWRARRLMRGCLDALAAHRELQRQRYLEAAAYSDVRVTGAVLASWRVAAVVSRQTGVQLSKLKARASRRLLSRSFGAWLGHVDDMNTARRTAEAMGVRHERALLSASLEAWWAATRGAVEARSRQEAQLLAARRRIGMGLLRRTLSHWAAHAADLLDLRAEADRRFAASMSALLSLALAGWLDLTQRQRAARATAQTRGSVADRALLRASLDAWRDEAGAARARTEAAAAMAARRGSAVVLPAVLRAWAALAGDDARLRLLQRCTLGHLVVRRCLALQRRAFQAWRGAVVERQAERDDLRRCIKRKKLAFSLFKQWYWEAFDSDVQATIRRMFHSTDPAAHSPFPSLHNRPGATTSRRTTASSYAPSYGVGAGARTAQGHPFLDLDPAARNRTLAAATAERLAQSTAFPQSQTAQPAARAPAPTAAAAGLPHRLQQQYPPVQPQRPAGPQDNAPRDPWDSGEPVRALAPAFDSLATRTGAAAPTPHASSAAAQLAARSQPAVPRNAQPAPAPTRGGGSQPPPPQQQQSSSKRPSGPGSTASASRPTSTYYPLWRPSDSEGSDQGTESEGLSAGAGISQGRAGGTGSRASTQAPVSAATSRAAGRKDVAFGRSVAPKPQAAGGSGRHVEPAFALAAGRKPGPSSLAGSVSNPSQAARMHVPQQQSSQMASQSQVAGGALAGPLGSGGASAASSLEAVTAMNAVLVNVANQLTEVSKASLEIAAGVVASGAGGAGALGALSALGALGVGGPPGTSYGMPGGIPIGGWSYRATTGSIGNGGGPYGGAGGGAGGAYPPTRGSIDGSYGSSVATGPLTASVAQGVSGTAVPPQGGSHQEVGGSGSQPLALAIAEAPSPASSAAGLAGPLSPLSPVSTGALCPYLSKAYGNSGGGGGTGGGSGIKLPGVVPTWRQVAVNELYGMESNNDEDDEYDNGGIADGSLLGPVDPSYVGISGAGVAAVYGDMDADDDGAAGADYDDDDDDEATLADMDAAATGATDGSSSADNGDGRSVTARAAAAAAAGYSPTGAGILARAGDAHQSQQAASQAARGRAKAAAFVLAHAGVQPGTPAAMAGMGDRGVGGLTGSRAGSRASSQSSSCYFPQHSTYRNAVFQRNSEAEEQEGGDEDALR